MNVAARELPMRWWTLNHATDGIGRECPQHQTMGPAYDFAAPDSVHNLPFDALPAFEPNFNTVIIHGHAKLTDLVSSAPIRNAGFLVSGRLRAVLQAFALPVHRFYRVPVMYRGKHVRGYSWLHLPEPSLRLNDEMSIEAVESLIAEQSLSSLDLVRFYRPERFAYCFVTDALRLAMESAKISGVRFGTAKLFGPRAPEVRHVHHFRHVD